MTIGVRKLGGDLCGASSTSAKSLHPFARQNTLSSSPKIPSAEGNSSPPWVVCACVCGWGGCDEQHITTHTWTQTHTHDRHAGGHPKALPPSILPQHTMPLSLLLSSFLSLCLPRCVSLSLSLPLTHTVPKHTQTSKTHPLTFEIALDGVSLAGACLAIGNDGAIVALED